MKRPKPVPRHAVLLHPSLSFSGVTERLAATARVLEGQGIRVTILSTPGSQSRAFENEGFELRDVELPRTQIESPFAFRRLRDEVRGLEPTLLHATDESLAPLVAAIAGSLNVPYVFEVHHQVRERLPQTPNGLLASVIATSESLTEGIVNHGRVPRELVRTIRHAPRPLVFDDLPAPFDHDSPPRIGCAGYLDHRHSTEWFLEAARTLVRAGKRCHFLLLGEGPRELLLRRAIREANLGQHVTMGVPTTLTARTLATLDVYVSCRVAGGPSWISCQALGQGVPSIFAASGEAFHLVKDRHSGVLTEPGDGRRLAEEIELMIDNPDFARGMGRRARENILEMLPPDRFERDLAGVHAMALGTAVST